MSNYTSLKGVSNYGDSLLNDQITYNLLDYFQWGLLGIGAFVNVTIPQSGAYGGLPSRLRCAEDPYFPSGCVWEAYRNNWVWQSGVEYSVQPIQISGVFVNGGFAPATGVGPYAFTINYPLGRIIFNTPISPTSVVQCEYAYNHVNLYTADTQWFKDIQFNSLRIDDSQFLAYGSGVWATLSQSRVQLPAVVVEVVPRRSYEGYQMGGGEWVYQDVLFHIFAENPYERNNLSDIFSYQYRKNIYLYDRNMVNASGAFPLTLSGSLSTSPMTYPVLVNTFQNKKLFFYAMSSENQEMTVPGLYQSVVRATVEVENAIL